MLIVKRSHPSTGPVKLLLERPILCFAACEPVDFVGPSRLLNDV
jgi:hypothetical protein